MATEIINNGATLKVVVNGVAKLIAKSQILTLSIVKTNIIKMDTGQGIYNTFISYPDVTNPATPNVEALRDEINTMLTTGGAGSATEGKQDSEIAELQDIKSRMDNLLGKVDILNDRVLIEAILVDESNPNVIYKGYALAGGSTASPVWAIEKVSANADITIKQWADGNKNFDNIWDNRATLTYS